MLILGGTGEAAQLAEQAVELFPDHLDVIYSLAGRVKPERAIAATVRVGGFGGGAGLANFIKDEKIDLLIDATHPFAANISANAYDACLETTTPRLMFIRPPWDLPPGAKYLEADDMAHAAEIISGMARKVFVTTGQSGLDALGVCADTHFVIRVIEEPAQAPAIENFTLITDRPPYSLENEVALMEEHQIDALLTKQSGGEGTVAKMVAAIQKKIPIIMISRPLPEPGDSVESVKDALKWLQMQL